MCQLLRVDVLDVVIVYCVFLCVRAVVVVAACQPTRVCGLPEQTNKWQNT